MKCTNCRTRIPKHNTICTSCRKRSEWLDIGDGSVGLAVFWLFSMAIAFGISAAVADAIGPESDTTKFIIILIIPLIWIGLLYALLFLMLGPGMMYKCDKCSAKNDGPMYFCSSCGALNVKKGIGNHLIGVFMGFCMVAFFFVILEGFTGEDSGASVCMIGLFASLIAAVGLFIPIRNFKMSMADLETRLPDIQRQMHEEQKVQFMYGAPYGQPYPPGQPGQYPPQPPPQPGQFGPTSPGQYPPGQAPAGQYPQGQGPAGPDLPAQSPPMAGQYPPPPPPPPAPGSRQQQDVQQKAADAVDLEGEEGWD